MQADSEIQVSSKSNSELYARPPALCALRQRLLLSHGIKIVWFELWHLEQYIHYIKARDMSLTG